MPRTITGTTTTGIVLSTPTDNPVTVAGGALVESSGFALIGGSRKGYPDYNFPWTITNLGYVEGKGGNSTGIVLYGGGTINNYNYISGGRQGIYTYYRPATVINKGLISAYGTNGVGIILSAGGRVTNDGTVFGDVGGVKIQGANATLANYGTIKNRASAPFGVSLDGFLGNFVTNTGYIEDNVIETGAPGTLVNSGTIVGSVSIGHSGIVTNGVSGSTAAQIDGFFTNITGGVGTITNYGTISGFFEGVDLSAGGVVNNAQPGAVITTGNSGQEGIFIGGYTHGTVTNLGTVEVNGSVGVAVNLATAGGTLTNGSTSVSTALIEFATQTEGFGVYSSPVASITNYGTVSAGTGIFLKSGGNAFNTGSAARIAAEFTGINLPGASPTDTVVNTGTVDADGLANNKYISSYGVRIETGSIVNGGTAATQALIIADPTGLDTPTAPVPMHSFGVEFVAGGNLTNYGTVAGARGGVDISAGVVTNGPGDVRSALIEGRYYGVHTAGTAAQSVAVTNFGTISAIGTAGIGIDFDDTADNTVSNSGTIDGGGGTAIAFGAGDDLLIVRPGAVFDGVVNGGGGGNEIDFHTSGKISLAPEFIGFARVRLVAAASLALKPSDLAGLAGKAITVIDGTAGDTVSAAALTATEEATVKGGAGNDVFVGGAGKDIFTGGAGADTFDFSAAALGAGDRVLGGSGADELVMTTPGTVTATGVSGVETYRLANGKPNDLRLTTGNFIGTIGAAITIIDGNAGDTVNAIALALSDRTTVVGGSGNDVFIGSAGTDFFNGHAGNDTFRFSIANLSASDVVKGGDGNDTLFLTSAGTVAAGEVSGVETYRLANGGADRLTLTAGNFAGATGATITVVGGNTANTVDAHLAGAHDETIMVGGAGEDVFIGGPGTDIFEFSFASLAATDIVQGGGGSNRLQMTSAGKIAATGVSGVETYRLANGGANTLSLTNANFAGTSAATITVIGGRNGNTVSEAGVSASDRAVLVGGAGADILTAGRRARLTGGAGADQFVFTTPGSAAIPDANTITDFSHGLDKIVFRDAAFNLGIDEGKGTATAQAIAGSLFSTSTNGSVATTANRFAYNAKTGGLFYDADGSGKADASQRIATLTNDPTLTASDLFFIK